MDETVRIYNPRSNTLVIDPYSNDMFYVNLDDVKNEIKRFDDEMSSNQVPKKQKETRFDTLRKVVNDIEKRTSRLANNHPWAVIFYRWAIALLIVLLFASFVWWGMDIHIRHKAEALTASAMAEVQAEAEAKETARLQALAAEKASEDYVVKEMATSLSKLYYGIKNFEEKYHYSDTDFETYGRSVFNRVENSKYPNDLFDVINQEKQWVGYSDSNPVIDHYYNLAEKHVRMWRTETTKPVSNDYVFAELTENGIYLRNKFDADGYARRWRAGS